jgi:hypothetical protein
VDALCRAAGLSVTGNSSDKVAALMKHLARLQASQPLVCAHV